MPKSLKAVFLLIVLLGAGGIGMAVFNKLKADGGSAGGGKRETPPAPVQASPVTRGLIELRRTFSGTLEASARFEISPKVAGRIVNLEVDLADVVKRGLIVARLDDAEFVQAVASAEAELAVAQANAAETGSALETADRELARVQALRERGIASESQLDTAAAGRLAAQAAAKVALAQVSRAEAAVETARIRLGYTRIVADWNGEEAERIVAERFVEEGETVSANTPLMAIVTLHPILGVVYATEKDYGRLQNGQDVALMTDAYPGRRFPGRINRIAPVFKESSRQARVELHADNTGHELKPGMFIRAEVVLDRVEDAVIVPVEAVTRRGGETGLFVVDTAGETVKWVAVAVGIQDGGKAQVIGEGVTGRVVSLGQQLIQDGSRIRLPEASVETGR